ncbi:unnamed protein product, partial [Ectocarpus sp. 4 AP-2014]
MRLEASISLPFSCHAVEFSPFDGERVAVATAQFFGIVGNGRLHIFGRHGGDVTNSSPDWQQRELRSFDTQAGLFDCAWSECHPHQMATAGADGVVKLWDLGAVDGFPVADWREHTQEVSGVDWNLVSKDLFASASWDGSVKLWTPSAGVSSHTFRDHGRHPVYGAIWSPFSPGQLLSFSGDGTARVLDVNSPGAVTVLDGHGGAEVLAGDWDKYNHPVVATGCADRAVRTWDLRQPRAICLVSSWCTVMTTLPRLCCACTSPQSVLPAPTKADALIEMGLVRQHTAPLNSQNASCGLSHTARTVLNRCVRSCQHANRHRFLRHPSHLDHFHMLTLRSTCCCNILGRLTDL